MSKNKLRIHNDHRFKSTKIIKKVEGEVGFSNLRSIKQVLSKASTGLTLRLG